MTRTDRGKEQYFDPEIEKTARKLRKEAAALKHRISTSSSSSDHTEGLPEIFELIRDDMERPA